MNKKIDSAKALLAAVIILAAAGTTAVIFLITGRKKDGNEIYVLKEPDSIEIEGGGKTLTLEKGTDGYRRLHGEIKKCWDASLRKGRLEFVLLIRVDEPIGDEVKVIYRYDRPIDWSMYGNEDMEKLPANTYLFLPFDDIYGYNAIICRDLNYREKAYIVTFKTSAELRGMVEELI